jgi:hypothetical protein
MNFQDQKNASAVAETTQLADGEPIGENPNTSQGFLPDFGRKIKCNEHLFLWNLHHFNNGETQETTSGRNDR